MTYSVFRFTPASGSFVQAGLAGSGGEGATGSQIDGAAYGSGIFLQLGAFSAREAAENLRTRIYRDLAWLSETIQVVASGALYRLHLGPYRTQDEARSIAGAPAITYANAISAGVLVRASDINELRGGIR